MHLVSLRDPTRRDALGGPVALRVWLDQCGHGDVGG